MGSKPLFCLLITCLADQLTVTQAQQPEKVASDRFARCSPLAPLSVKPLKAFRQGSARFRLRRRTKTSALSIDMPRGNSSGYLTLRPSWCASK